MKLETESMKPLHVIGQKSDLIARSGTMHILKQTLHMYTAVEGQPAGYSEKQIDMGR